MLVVPDPTTAFLDPFATATTLVLICNIRDPVTGQTYSRDARYVAEKAETYLKSTGLGDAAYFGPEAEFFVFNEVRYGQGINYAMHEIDSKEGTWNTGAKEATNLGHKPRQKEGYFPVPPVDSMQDLRSEMVLTMEALGIQIEAHHHEVSTGGQAEIDMRFTTLTRMADNLMMYKYVVKNVARKHGMTATFMPKPLFEDNASGMHVHQSIWKGKTNLFHGTQYAELSELGRFYIDGILNRIDPGKPIDKNLYDLPPAEAKEVKSTPGSLEQALDALEADHAFLLRGDVFTKDVIETWLGYKRDKEIDAIRLRPHPYEFHLYYDI